MLSRTYVPSYMQWAISILNILKERTKPAGLKTVLLLPDTSFGFGTITAEMRSLNYASTCMQQALSAVKSANSFTIHIHLSGFRKAES